jgi:quinol monooxygenase YgiN
VIIVTGSVKARPETRDEIERISLEHVARSRLEPGCLLHSVHRDLEDSGRFVFIEHWADREVLRAHFRVPESGAFATALAEFAAEPPTMEIYDVTALSSESA